MRSIEDLELALEHEKRNLAHREDELITAREAWDKAKRQYDNVRYSVRDLQCELISARLLEEKV
jgi:hypothetical protein